MEKPEINFLPVGSVENEKYIYAVICSFIDNRLLLVRTNGRSTWEIPGGRREPGEDINTTASRELMEETGAEEFVLQPVADYTVTLSGSTSFGRLFVAHIRQRIDPAGFETDEAALFDAMPLNLTYPSIQPVLLKYVESEFTLP